MAAKSTFNSSQNDVFGNMSDDDDDDDLNFNLDGSGFGSEDDEDTNQQSSSMSDDLFDDDLPSSDEDADPYTDPNDIFNQMSDDDDDDEDDEIQEPDEPPAPAPQPAPAPKKPAARHRGRPRKTPEPQQAPVAPQQQAPIQTPQPAQSPQPADDYFNDNTDDMQSMQVIDDYQQQPDDAYYQNQQQTMPTDDNNMQSYDYMAQQPQAPAQQNNNAYMQAQSQQAMYEAQSQQYAQQDNNPFMQDTQQQSQVKHQPSHAQAPKPFAAPQESAVSAWHGEIPNPNMIQRIIAVSDSIRNDLSSDEKNAVRAVMNAKQISGDELADLTYAVLTARKSTMTALEELLTARNKDIASRVFYLLRLNDDDLQTIYNIGIAFDAQQDTMSGNSLDHYAISEQANQAVSTLSDNSIDLLQAVYNIYNKSKALMNE